MSVVHLSRDSSADEVGDALEREGALVIDDVLSAAELETLQKELAPWIAATAKGGEDFSGRETTRTGALIERSPLVRELCLHPQVLGACEKVIGKHNHGLQMHVTQMIGLGPEETPQPPHRDNWAFDFFPFPNEYHVMVNCLYAITDFTEASGATRVVPRSHLLGDKLRLEHSDTVPVEMRAGSVLLFVGSIYHGGGANTTDEIRYGLILAYVAKWLRQEENQYLSVSREVARQLPERLQRLLGYDQLFSLGYVGDSRHPLEVLKGQAS